MPDNTQETVSPFLVKPSWQRQSVVAANKIIQYIDNHRANCGCQITEPACFHHFMVSKTVQIYICFVFFGYDYLLFFVMN